MIRDEEIDRSELRFLSSTNCSAPVGVPRSAPNACAPAPPSPIWVASRSAGAALPP
jgi:hypothetical protein